MGNLSRPMRFGDKRINQDYYQGPSMLAHFFLHNWAHIKIILEADGLMDVQIL